MKNIIIGSVTIVLVLLIAVITSYADMKIDPDKITFQDGSIQSVASVGGGGGSLNDLSDAKVKDGSFYVGTNSGISESAGEHRNVGLGKNTLRLNTSGKNNTAIGFDVLGQNTTSHGNTAVGSYALTNNTGAVNTAVGLNACFSNTTGTGNVCVGFQANSWNQEGDNNTIIGSNAGIVETLHSKSGNVFIGYSAGYNETRSSKLYIENSDSSTPLIGGDFASDWVDINGTLNIKPTDLPGGVILSKTYPESALTINANHNTKILFKEDGNSAASLFYEGFDKSGTANLVHLRSEIANNLQNIMTWKLNGNVGIGASDPSHLLQVAGVARSTQSTWATSSDSRVKTDIKHLKGSLEKIKQLNPVTFEYIETYRKDNEALAGRKTGFIAQEVAEIDPTMVSEVVETVGDQTIEDFNVLNTGNMIPMLVEGMKEQQKTIEELRAENYALRQDISQIKEMLGL